MTPKLYHLHALSALHCGTGQSASVIDLPIARDRATHLPMVPGSSLRGVLREDFAARDDAESKQLEITLFGPSRIEGAEGAKKPHAGALAVGDAHLLLLPVRALAGIVAYATCPYILKRYAALMRYATYVAGADLEIPIPNETEAIHTSNNQNHISGKVVLEDLDLHGHAEPAAESWAEKIATVIFPDDENAQTDLKERFLILPDAVFAFLAETATEIRTRIAIDRNTGTVRKGALWYEENLPAESVLWGVYALSDSRVEGETFSAASLETKIPAQLLLQLGGKAGVGRGLTRFISGGGQ